jgi:DNA polymerase-3 subunit delta
MFYVFDGDDGFSLREEMSALMEKMGDPALAELNTTVLDGRTTDLSELELHCSTAPFLTDRRLVIVEGLLERLSPKGKSQADARFLEGLLAYLADLPDTTRLFFVEQTRLSPRNPVRKLATESPMGHAKTFVAPSGTQLVQWVQRRVRQLGGQIERSAAEALCAYVGNDLYQLRQECEKLVAYTNGERPIQEQDIRLLTPHARSASIFDLVDALGRRDGETASRICHELLDMGEHPLALLGMIARQFRLMIQVKELAPTMARPEAIARELGQNPYPIKKILSQSQNYSLAQLRTVYHKLLDTDVEIKTGQANDVLALDMLIAGLSRVT